MKHWNIDLDDEQIKEIPLAGRKSISILLGAGFSAPKGYPIGNEINKRLLNFDESVDFSPSGTLTNSVIGQKPKFQIGGVYNIHQKSFIFCKCLMNEYEKAHNEEFDYELFYDFIKSDEVKEKRYQVLCDDLLSGLESFEYFLSNVSHIYNQMIAHLLKDRDGKTFYDDEPSKINNVDGYNEFLNYINQLSQEYIINVHTLNHDLLFESFNKVSCINGRISDGFDEYGSEYYGKLMHHERTYHCRLERYTSRYNTPVRLFKLHGSIDYVPFYKGVENGFMKPDKYVKIKRGMGVCDIMKSRKSKIGYDKSPFEYHPDFLTGTTSKIQRYNEPLFFKKLFKRFKKNLEVAEKLIIIGYGCKDVRINDIIKECFDYQHKPSFIVDKYAGDMVAQFGKEINAVIYKNGIDSIKSGLFM